MQVSEGSAGERHAEENQETDFTITLCMSADQVSAGEFR